MSHSTLHRGNAKLHPAYLWFWKTENKWSNPCSDSPFLSFLWSPSAPGGSGEMDVLSSMLNYFFHLFPLLLPFDWKLKGWKIREHWSQEVVACRPLFGGVSTTCRGPGCPMPTISDLAVAFFENGEVTLEWLRSGREWPGPLICIPNIHS